MIYWQLFIGFLQVGCFAFGGAYGAIPLIRDVVLANGWLTEEKLTYMIAVSESTPGPIMVNLATYVGSSQAGLLGAMISTLAVVLPSFFVILLIMVLLKTVLQQPWMQAVLRGVKPCMAGIILATGIYMVCNHCVSFGEHLELFPNHAAPCLCYVRERFPVPEKALPHRAHCLIRRAWYYSLWHMTLLLKGHIFQP